MTRDELLKLCDYLECNDASMEAQCEAAAFIRQTLTKPTWVGLEDEELSEVYNQADWDTVNGWEYERAIEAKLKERNT